MREPTPPTGTEERQRIELVKVDGLCGGLPVGATFELLHPPHRVRHEAERRTFRALQREHPGENTLCWQVAGGSS